MLQIIKSVLAADVLAEFRDILSKSVFIDGGQTAGKTAQALKHSLELDPSAPERDMLAKAALGALMSRDEFQHGAMPLKVSTPIFAKYTAGMAYGHHVDNPMMGAAPNVYRCDVSLTLFLSEPGDYDGGELSIHTDFGEQTLKLDAGDVAVYPSSSLHRVKPISSGERLVMVAWVQSQIRQPAKREMLFDLWQAQSAMGESDADARERLEKIHANLWRMWADT